MFIYLFLTSQNTMCVERIIVKRTSSTPTLREINAENSYFRLSRDAFGFHNYLAFPRNNVLIVDEKFSE